MMENKSITISKKLKILIAATAILLAAAAAFAGLAIKDGADRYKDHYYTGTALTIVSADGTQTFGSFDLSERTLEEAEAYVSSVTDGYSLTVTYYDGSSQEITAEEIGYGISSEDMDQLSDCLANQDAGHWYKYATGLKSAAKSQELVLTLSYDESLVEKAVEGLQCVNPEEKTEAADAYLAYDEATHLYVINEAVMGNTVDPDKVLEQVTEALDKREAEITISIDEYDQPEITSEDEFLNAKKDEVNHYLSAEITVADGDKSIVIDGSVIRDFLVIDEDWNVSISDKAIQKFVNANFDDLFDTVGRTRTVSTLGSGTVTIGGGTYGKTVRTLDEVNLLRDEVKAGEVTTRTPCYYNDYENTSDNDGIGDSYIDVNIADQKVYVVIDNEIVVETSCVTGTADGEHDTPKGIYFVIRKATDYTMVKYEAFVNYWMPINDKTGVGLHDATWRGSFGGSIYKTNGSHGCINLPLGKTAEIYEAVYPGIPVLVH